MRYLGQVICAVALLMVATLGSGPTQAAIVVASCPNTFGSPLPVGKTGQDILVDINGNLCTSASGGGGGGDVNLTQILGAAPSLTNPLWVFPATGATFPVSGTFWQATQPSSIASAQVASGAFASGSIGAGAIASGAVASGAYASGAFASGAFASGSIVNGADVVLGNNADSAACTSGTSLIACMRQVRTDTAALVSGLLTPPIQTTLTSQYPATAVPITASATGTTGATTATLTNVSGHTTYICGYSVRANATAATTVANTVTGVITATMTHEMWVAPAASGLGVDEQIFTPCIPASAVSTSIGVVSGAPGSGGLVSVTAWGYSL
jgi:hypothetical protein